ncbi:hypothetical protein CF651_00310 [Paenibacillus rigui]|uniref:Uncharacterized protein n=1 Tax=Paenibacillus rigui TaxID=554312 RepID=A0A229UYY8_9BACL|nr:hypothetical protein CF651_00310 [Paenibacillus rigui]
MSYLFLICGFRNTQKKPVPAAGTAQASIILPSPRPHTNSLHQAQQGIPGQFPGIVFFCNPPKPALKPPETALLYLGLSGCPNMI